MSSSCYVQQLLAMLQFTSLPWLHRIACPALIMGGSDDPLIRNVNARVLAMLIRDSQLKIIEGGGHLFMVLQPEATAAEVERFLSGAWRLLPMKPQSPATRTTSLPKLRPCSSPMNACGAFSRPSTRSSRSFTRPLPIHSPMSRRKASKRSA